MNTTIHIGQLLLNYFEKHRTRKAALARLLQVKPTAILRYQKRDSLQISILINISHALKHNFLMQLGEELEIPYETKAEKELKQQLQNLHQENRDLKRENELLKEILKR